ncbi:MAG: S8 family serine peptidase, partial [Dolichospermum sp.]
YSTVPNNQYANYSGTSMAAPHIVGVVALMLGANPNLTESQVRQIIISTSANSTSPTEPTTPTQPGLQFPSFFPPLDSFFPLELTNIISQLPLSFQSPTLTSTTLPPIFLSRGDTSRPLSFNMETLPVQPSDDSQKKEANPFLTRLTLQYYESGKAPCQNETDRLYNLNAIQMR